MLLPSAEEKSERLMQKSRGILKMAKVKFKVCFVILFSYMYLQKIIGIENKFLKKLYPI